MPSGISHDTVKFEVARKRFDAAQTPEQHFAPPKCTEDSVSIFGGRTGPATPQHENESKASVEPLKEATQTPLGQSGGRYNEIRWLKDVIDVKARAQLYETGCVSAKCDLVSEENYLLDKNKPLSAPSSVAADNTERVDFSRVRAQWEDKAQRLRSTASKLLRRKESVETNYGNTFKVQQLLQDTHSRSLERNSETMNNTDAMSSALRNLTAFSCVTGGGIDQNTTEADLMCVPAVLKSTVTEFPPTHTCIDSPRIPGSPSHQEDAQECTVQLYCSRACVKEQHSGGTSSLETYESTAVEDDKTQVVALDATYGSFSEFFEMESDCLNTEDVSPVPPVQTHVAQSCAPVCILEHTTRSKRLSPSALRRVISGARKLYWILYGSVLVKPRSATNDAQVVGVKVQPCNEDGSNASTLQIRTL